MCFLYTYDIYIKRHTHIDDNALPLHCRINEKTRTSYSVDKAAAMFTEIETLRNSYKLRNREKRQLLLVGGSARQRRPPRLA